MEIFNHNSNVNFLGMRKFSIAIAGFLMIASIALIATKGLNYGLDFNGGVSLVVDYDQPVQINDVRAALAKGGVSWLKLFRKVVASSPIIGASASSTDAKSPRISRVSLSSSRQPCAQL